MSLGTYSKCAYSRAVYHHPFAILSRVGSFLYLTFVCVFAVLQLCLKGCNTLAIKIDIEKLDAAISNLQELRSPASEPALEHFVEIDFRSLRERDYKCRPASIPTRSAVKGRGDLKEFV